MNAPIRPRIPTRRVVLAIILAIVGIAGSLWLFLPHPISEASFVAFVFGSIICGLVVAFADRIQSISLRELKVEFERVQEARKEVEERERRVTAIASILSDITEKVASRHGLIIGDAVREEDKRWLEEKRSELKAIIER